MEEQRYRLISLDRITAMKEVHRVQGADGNWDYDPYMLGLFNGMEFMLSLLEDRNPDFRTPRRYTKRRWWQRRPRIVQAQTKASV